MDVYNMYKCQILNCSLRADEFVSNVHRKLISQCQVLCV